MRRNSNKKSRIGIFLILIVLVSSCDDFLDTETVSEISDTQFWQSNKDLETGVLSAYDALQGVLRRNYWHWGEGRSDNFSLNEKPSVETQQLLENSIDASNPSADWSQVYRAIGLSNLVIDKSKDIENANMSLVAEAYAIRAFCYFYSIRVWDGVPKITEPVTDAALDVKLPRSSSQDIIDNVIIPDLLEAEKLISRLSGHTRFTIGGVWALMAHVYMWNDQYELAIEAVDNIIDGGSYTLVEDRESWSEMFIGEEGSELIFSLGFNTDADVGSGRSQAKTMLNDGSPDYIYSSKILASWKKRFPTDSQTWVALYPDFSDREFYGDWRLLESMNTDDGVNQEEWDRDNRRVTTKFKKEIGGDADIDGTDYPIFRYAGILLLKAEAEAGLFNQTVALELVNEIRISRELPTVDVNQSINVIELIDFILEERQYELYAEGHRWFDLRRHSRVLDVMEPINGFDNEDLLVWPVSVRAMARNGELIQNDGYIVQ
ncbi:MAG: RagB/SusD family nutrient uptake outer membrane protein [Cyclobacteriaceae bacterium]